MIRKLELNNFRNHSRLILNFNKNFIYIYGDNGSGKTSILEAIYFLSTAKSFRTSEDKELIRLDEQYAKLTLKTVKNEYEVVLSKAGKRVFIDKNEKKKVSEYIGGYLSVVFALEDLNLIKGTPGDRRQFMDLEFSQIDKEYLKILNDYKKILKQRNVLLKKIKINDDYTMLDILGNSLYETGIKIIEKRRKYLNELNEKLVSVYKNFSNNKIELIYKPNVSESEFFKWINNNQGIDILYESTFAGVHKDDLLIKINNNDAKSYASNGEQRLIVISLKMGLLNQIKEYSNKEVVLLLDDVLSELDKNMEELVLNKIPRDNMIIITSAQNCKINENIEIIMLKKER